jgi:hypothetical protein
MRCTEIVLMTSPHYVLSPAKLARLAKAILADLLSFVKTSLGHNGSFWQNADTRLVSKMFPNSRIETQRPGSIIDILRACKKAI